jgi:outer membrane protein OmpA-like peptidoglycan-associated protein
MVNLKMMSPLKLSSFRITFSVLSFYTRCIIVSLILILFSSQAWSIQDTDKNTTESVTRPVADSTSDFKPSLRVHANFSSIPYSFNQASDSTYSNLSGDLFIGARLTNISMGAAVDLRYFWFNGYRPLVRQFAGALFILRGLYQVMYSPYEWLEMYWAVGGGWLATAFEENAQGFIQENLAGVSFTSGADFHVWRFITLTVPLSLDFFINSSKYYVYFYGGGRITFHPYFQWINIFMELGGLTWQYKDVYMNYNTGLLIWKIGAGIQLDVNRTRRELVDLKNKIHEKKSLTNEDKTRKQLWQLRYALKGQTLSFDQILFQSNTAMLTKESREILDRIADILLQRKNIYIELGGYTNYTGYPDREMELSIERATAVATYLNKKGMSYEQMKIAGYGSGAFSSRDRDIEETKRRVEITILEVFKD